MSLREGFIVGLEKGQVLLKLNSLNLAKKQRVAKEVKMLTKGKKVEKEKIKEERMLVTVVVCGLYMLSKAQPLPPVPSNQPM